MDEMGKGEGNVLCSSNETLLVLCQCNVYWARKSSRLTDLCECPIFDNI